MLYRLDLPLEAFFPASRALSRRGNFILPRRERPLLAGKKRLRVLLGNGLPSVSLPFQFFHKCSFRLQNKDVAGSQLGRLFGSFFAFYSVVLKNFKI